MKKLLLCMLLGSMILCVAGCGRKGENIMISNSEAADELREELQETQTAQDNTENIGTSDGTESFDTVEGFAQKSADIEYGERISITYDSNTTGTTRKANVILPEGYSEEKQYPVLYLLHGIGGDHNEWLAGSPDIIIGNLIANEEAEEMIVVMPNVRARENDGANPSDIYTVEHFQAFDNFINDLKNDLMPYMEANYSIATGRENTAIAGLSMGGREALYIGLSMPETFGYIGAFCPAVGVLPYNIEDGLFQTEELKIADGYESLILIVAGSTDSVVGDWPKTYSDTLTENGTENTYYVTTGGHDFTVWKHGLYNFAKRIFKE